jgi:hypothetical protein
MSKTYSLQGPIMLEALNAQDALAFAAAVIDAVPSYSMGTASLNIKAQGQASTDDEQITGSNMEGLKTSLAAAEETISKAAEDIIYDVRGQVNLVGLSFEDGMQLIDTVMRVIPTDTLVLTAMLVQQEK